MTTAESANPSVPAVVPARATRSWMSWLLPPATILAIVVGAVLLLMTPLWMHAALSLGGSAYTGAGALITPQQSYDFSDRVVGELFFGPGTFSSFEPDEAAHMRDVRLVLFVFLGLAIASALLIVWSIRIRGQQAGTWRAIARGGKILAVGTILLGVFAAVAFDTAFELFHRIFFPGGNWAFSADSLLIRLYPYAFWELTSVALGVLLVVAGAAVWYVARRRAAQLEARP